MFSSSPASSGRRQVGFSSASLASSTARRWVRARSPGSVNRSLPRVSSSSSTGRMTARAQRWSVARNSTITSRSPSTPSSQVCPSSQSRRSGKTNSSVSRSLDSALANVCTGSGSGTLRIRPPKGCPWRSPGAPAHPARRRAAVPSAGYHTSDQTGSRIPGVCGLATNLTTVARACAEARVVLSVRSRLSS